MSMLDKFNEHKKIMHKKLDEAQDNFFHASSAATDEFIGKFESLVANASEDEFNEFLREAQDELEEEDVLAAIAMRIKSNMEKRHKGINIVVIDDD